MSTERAPDRVHRPTTAGDPRVTVAVITRDRSASLVRTLDVLAALPERPPVVVVDNSRDDATRRAVAGHPAIARLL
ncbi:glycosyltransferase family 2 protein, partial [Streptomyces olivaceoviridis]